MNVNKANWESVYFCQTTQHTQLTTDSTACTHATAAHAWKAPKKIHPLVHPQKITWGDAIKMCKDMFLFLEPLKLTNQQPMIKHLGLTWVWPFQKRRSTIGMYWLLLHQAPRHPGKNTIAKSQTHSWGNHAQNATYKRRGSLDLHKSLALFWATKRKGIKYCRFSNETQHGRHCSSLSMVNITNGRFTQRVLLSEIKW